MEISLQESPGILPSEAVVEIVERKGLGHPDSICDAVVEHVSRALSSAYLARFGRVLHFNCDKGALLAGQAEVRLGGGRVLEPMTFVLGDRATTSVGHEHLDVQGVARGSIRDWFRSNLPRIDPDKDLRIQVALRPGSVELVRLFDSAPMAIGANDTSAVVGYAPLTETEHLVLEAETFLTSSGFKSRFPGAGEDVKVMGVRRGRELELTVAIPLLDRHVRSESDYVDQKKGMADALGEHLRARLEKLANVEVRLNALDRPGLGVPGMYLSVLGTSAEHGDSGSVGRGNDISGFWSLNRPQSGEAAPGKNPVSHVGKIYAVLAHEAAGLLYRNVPGVRAATVWMAGRIGEPLANPWVAAVQVSLAPGVTLGEVSESILETLHAEVSRLPTLSDELIRGTHRLF
jgi:S-adenosylmethionine synthetase